MMQSGKVMGLLVALAVLVIAVAHFQNSARTATPQAAARAFSTAQWNRPSARRPAVTLDQPSTLEESLDPPAVDYDCRRILKDGKRAPQLPREAVEAYLQKRQRSAESLLAAYHALDDTNLLAEAAVRFPNDPQVQWTVLNRDLFPEERRKWLELFKASAPDNALPNYLSAQEHLDNRYQEETGNWRFGPDQLPLQDYMRTAPAQAAINELLEAASKPLFKNFTLEACLDEEALNLAAGRSSLQARLGATGWESDVAPELARFKSIAVSLQQFEKAYLSAGDTASAQNLAQIGLALANRLRAAGSGKLNLDQLVGTASEAIHLHAWDANTSYDFLGGKTPKERLAEMKQERASLRSLTATVREQLPSLGEADLLSYLDRQRIYGEAEAMRWLQARTQTATTAAPLP